MHVKTKLFIFEIILVQIKYYFYKDIHKKNKSINMIIVKKGIMTFTLNIFTVASNYD